MKRRLRKITALFLTVLFLIPCLPAFADAVQSIEWETPLDGKIELAASPDGKLPVLPRITYNTVTVTFSGTDSAEASLIVTPVIGGVAAEPTEETTEISIQVPVVKKTAVFEFDFSKLVEEGVYAVHISGSNTEASVGYFEVSDNQLFRLAEGQTFQYDDYKKHLDLVFDVTDADEFLQWSLNKDKMYIKLKNGEKEEIVDPSYITIDTNNNVVSIDAEGYQKIMPPFGTQLVGNVNECIVTYYIPGYMSMSTGTIGLVTPDISAEGFANGVDFDFQIYSATPIPSARCILGVYDDGRLVAYELSDEIALKANTDNRVTVTVKEEGLNPSGKFSVRAILWKGTDVVPLASVIKFP